MRASGWIAALALCPALSACMVVPVVDYENSSKCRTVTHSMSLKMVEVGVNGMRCRDEACLAIVLAAPALSAIVSGSIVLTNNTVHWLEYHGTCSDGYLNTARQRFLEAFSNPQPLIINVQ